MGERRFGGCCPWDVSVVVASAPIVVFVFVVVVVWKVDSFLFPLSHVLLNR